MQLAYLSGCLATEACAGEGAAEGGGPPIRSRAVLVAGYAELCDRAHSLHRH